MSLTMEFLLGGRAMVLRGMSDALADLAAAAARCAGSDEMALPRVVLCIRFWTMEFLLSGRTMVLLGIERCFGLRVGNKMVLPRVVLNDGIFIQWADCGFAGLERCSGGLSCSACAMRWLG